MSCSAQLCRLCTGNENVSLTVLSVDSDNVLFMDKLEMIAVEIVDCNEKLPNGICTNCAAQLDDAYKFLKKCFEAQEILKELLSEELCRLCASDENTLLTLDNLDEDGVSISYKLETIAPEILECNEKLSDIVCSTCSLHLNETYKFIDKCFKSQEILKNDTTILQNETLIKKETDENEQNINFESVYIKEENISSELDETDMKDEIQTKNSNYECEICKKSFDYKSLLESHVRDMHPKEKSFKCEICGKTFVYKPHLKQHMVTHTKKTDFKCDICDKVFPQNTLLKRHKRIHSEDKPFKCEVCGKTFTYRHHVKQHSATHLIVKPFKCKLCEKTFSDSSNLKRHVRTHTKEKPFSCDVCGKAFAESTHVKQHSVIHTKLRPFKCNQCEKTYTVYANLKRHSRSHVKEKQPAHILNIPVTPLANKNTSKPN